VGELLQGELVVAKRAKESKVPVTRARMAETDSSEAEGPRRMITAMRRAERKEGNKKSYVAIAVEACLLLGVALWC
jgi:hypothetical protein